MLRTKAKAMQELTQNNIEVVNVETAGGNYPINIGKNRLSNVHESIPNDASTVAIITNDTINNLYG